MFLFGAVYHSFTWAVGYKRLETAFFDRNNPTLDLSSRVKYMVKMAVKHVI